MNNDVIDVDPIEAESVEKKNLVDEFAEKTGAVIGEAAKKAEKTFESAASSAFSFADDAVSKAEAVAGDIAGKARTIDTEKIARDAADFGSKAQTRANEVIDKLNLEEKLSDAKTKAQKVIEDADLEKKASEAAQKAEEVFSAVVDSFTKGYSSKR